jgi:hypothetical protein
LVANSECYGYQTANATQSNFFGTSAVGNATNTSYSNFMVQQAGKGNKFNSQISLVKHAGNNNANSFSIKLLWLLVMVQQMHLTQVSLELKLGKMQQVLIDQISLVLVLVMVQNCFILKFHWLSAGYEASGSSTSNLLVCKLVIKLK